MGEEPSKHHAVTLKVWQLIVALVVVAAIAVACTVGVNMVMRPDPKPTPTVTASDETMDSKVKETPEQKKEKQEQKPEKSVRGNLVKRVGDVASIVKSPASKTPVASWTLKGVTVDQLCSTPYAEPAENGHFVALDFDVTTGEDLTDHFMMPLNLGVSAQWMYYLKDGTLWNGMRSGTTVYNCLPETETLPQSIGNATKASGKVLFDLPTTDGILVFSPYGDGTGWEYNLKEYPNA